MGVDSDRRVKTGRDRAEVYREKAEAFLKRHTTPEACLAEFRDKNNGKRTRVFALLMAGALLVGARDALLNTLRRDYDFSRVPIDPDQYELEEQRVGLGYWSEVYLLRSKAEDKDHLVYKVEFPATHQRVEKLTDIIMKYRHEYETMKALYADLPHLIPWTGYFVTTSPRTGKPAIGSIQTYAGHDGFDLLDSERANDIHALIAGDDTFAKEFETFRRVTLELQKKRKAPDLAGKNNVLVVRNGDTHHIRLVDPHSFGTNNTHAEAGQREKIKYLESLDAGL